MKAKPRFIKNPFVSRDCLSFPRTVYWECTRRCNFRCIHCYSSSDVQSRFGELTLRQVKTFINQLNSGGVEFLSIGGGEPLMYPHLAEVIRYATRLSIGIEISTNASLVSKELISQLKEAGLKYVQVSIDGASESTYSKIRIGGDYNSVIKNIKKLSKSFVVSTCMVVNKLNYKEIGAVIDLSIRLGVKNFRIIPFMEVGRASNLGKLQLSKKQFRDIYKSIVRKRAEVGENIFIQLNENLIVPTRKSIDWMPEGHYGCSAGRSTIGVDSYGDVYPCSYMIFDELICGNVKERPLIEIWRNSSVLKMVRGLERLEGKCSKCKHLELCRGGCRAAAYLKRRKIGDSDYLCSVK